MIGESHLVRQILGTKNLIGSTYKHAKNNQLGINTPVLRSVTNDAKDLVGK